MKRNKMDYDNPLEASTWYEFLFLMLCLSPAYLLMALAWPFAKLVDLFHRAKPAAPLCPPVT